MATFPGIPRLSINFGAGGAFGVPQANMGMMPGVGFRVPGGMKGIFFDSAKVKNALDTASYHALLRFGQYVRGAAKRIMAKGYSSYGEAASSPSTRDVPYDIYGKRSKAIAEAREGKRWYQQGLLSKFTFYAYDPGGGVVIGPELKDGHGMGFGPYGSITVPELLEYGGVVGMTRRSARLLHHPSWQSNRITYKPMPYMGPAFEAGREKLKEFYQDAMEKYAHAA